MYIAGEVLGIRRVWCIGDDFLASTFWINYKMSEKQFFLKDNYKVTAFCGSRFSDKNSNSLSRIQISFATALNKSMYPPDFVIMILNDDLIEYLKFKNQGQAVMYREMLEWLVKAIAMDVHMKLQFLLEKVRSPEQPVIYWVQLCNNKHFETAIYESRVKFNLNVGINCETAR